MASSSKSKKSEVAKVTEATAAEETMAVTETTAEAVPEAVVETEPAAAPSAALEGTSGKTIYIGPRKRGLVTGTVYIGALGASAERLVSKYPLTRLLFVDINQLGDARIQLATSNSAMQRAYELALKASI